MASYASAAQKQRLLNLDIRDFFTFFESPSHLRVREAVRNAVPDDPSIIVRPLSGRLVGLFQVYTISSKSDISVVFPRTTPEGGTEDISIPLTLPGLNRGPREGTLITIVDGDVGDAHQIPGSAFDKALRSMGRSFFPPALSTLGSRNITMEILCASLNETRETCPTVWR